LSSPSSRRIRSSISVTRRFVGFADAATLITSFRDCPTHTLSADYSSGHSGRLVRRTLPGCVDTVVGAVRPGDLRPAWDASRSARRVGALQEGGS
jgi:hypothetical protein